MKTIFWFTSALTVLASAQCASAQTAPAPAAGAAAEQSGLEEIVVTAQRKSEDLQDVPISITALTGKALAASGINSTTQIAVATPGLLTQQVSTSFQPFIRGIGTNQTAQGSENSVAVYIDGVYQGSKTGNLFELNNIERVEVLKGPQGTLFGRNATGGAISIVTKDPSLDQGISAELGYGRFDQKTAKLYAAGNITDDLSASIAASGRWHDGWIRDVARGGKKVNPYKSQAGAVKFKWTPTDTLTSTLSGSYNFLNDPTFVAVHAEPGTLSQGASRGTYQAQSPDTSTTSNADPYLKTSGKRITWDNRLEAGQLDLVSITGLARTHLNVFVDQDASAASIQQLTTQQFAKQFSQEFQIQSNKNETFTWIAGTYYLWYKDYYGNDPDNNWASQTGLPNPVRPADLRVAGASIIGRSTGITTTSYSGFFEGKLEFAENTHLTAGLRYTRDKKHLEGSQYNYTAIADTSPNTVKLQNGVLANDGLAFGRTITSTVDLSKSWGRMTWRAVLNHDFADDVMGYLSYSRGFKSGNLNPGTVNNNQVPINPEEVDASEGGIKSQFLDRKLRVNASVFYNKFRNIQISLVTPAGGTQTQNAAAARIYGLDLEVVAAPTRGLTLRAAGNYLNAKYTSFPNAQISLPRVSTAACAAGAPLTVAQATTISQGTQTGGNCSVYALDASGLDLSYAPKFTGSLSGTYDIYLPGDSRISLNSSFYYNSGFDFYAGGFFAKTGKFETLAASVAWTAPDDRYFVRIWGENLTNDRHPLSILPTGQAFWEISNPPATYGVTLGFKFGG